MGSLEGIFVADPDRVRQLVESGEDVYFGEVLGKHSRIIGPVFDDDLTFVTDDEAIVALFETYSMATGFDPFDYFENETEDDFEESVSEEEDYQNEALRQRKGEWRSRRCLCTLF